jgi:hypothetical protein
MLFPVDRIMYTIGTSPVMGCGIIYREEDILNGFALRVVELFWDIEGRGDVSDALEKVATTAFETESLRRILSQPPSVEDWRVGEAIAEAYLVDNKNCQFPWPTARDLKNSKASPAGIDLVGFHFIESGVRFAFAEVKTSQEQRWPPSVVKGRHGLVKQIEELRDQNDVKDQIIPYLTLRSRGQAWLSTFHSATKKYLADPTDVSLFGVLIRDVEPKPEDIKNRVSSLATNCPAATSIELHVLYLPENKLTEFVAYVKNYRGRK